MSDTKHTPGPWVHIHAHVFHRADDCLIAKCSTPLRGSRSANANLIAAAPELYEALQQIADGSVCWFSTQTALAALAKARGGA